MTKLGVCVCVNSFTDPLLLRGNEGLMSSVVRTRCHALFFFFISLGNLQCNLMTALLFKTTYNISINCTHPYTMLASNICLCILNYHQSKLASKRYRSKYRSHLMIYGLSLFKMADTRQLSNSPQIQSRFSS